MHQLRGIQTSDLAVDPEVAHEPAPDPLSHSSGNSRYKNTKLSQTIDSERALYLGSSWTQPQSINSLAGTGTQQKILPAIPLEILKRPILNSSPSQPQSMRSTPGPGNQWEILMSAHQKIMKWFNTWL